MKLLFVWQDGRMRAIEYPEAPPCLQIAGHITNCGVPIKKSFLFERSLPEMADGKHDVVIYEQATQ